MQILWSFPQLIVNPREGELQNVVVGINWVCTATDGQNTAASSGTVMLGKPNPAEFIPYNDITESMAYNWVSESISMPDVQSSLMLSLGSLSRPVIQPQNPPF